MRWILGGGAGAVLVSGILAWSLLGTPPKPAPAPALFQPESEPEAWPVQRTQAAGTSLRFAGKLPEEPVLAEASALPEAEPAGLAAAAPAPAPAPVSMPSPKASLAAMNFSAKSEGGASSSANIAYGARVGAAPKAEESPEDLGTPKPDPKGPARTDESEEEMVLRKMIPLVREYQKSQSAQGFGKTGPKNYEADFGQVVAEKNLLISPSSIVTEKSAHALAEGLGIHISKPGAK